MPPSAIGSPSAHRPGIDQVEQRCIFEREQARQPGIVGVAHAQPGLKTIEGGVSRKSRRGEAKLARRGNVLGVVDDQKFAARFRQREVERARLGRRLSGRRDDDFVARRQVKRDEAGQRLVVAPFDNQLYVQFALGIVERVEGLDQLLNDIRLPIDRGDDGVGRQLVVREGAGRLFVCVRHCGQRTQSNRGHKQEPQGRRRDKGKGVDAHGADCGGHNRDKAKESDLRGEEAVLRRKVFRKARKRIVENGLRTLRADQRGEPLGRGHRKTLGTQPAREGLLQETGRDGRVGGDDRPRATMTLRERRDPASQPLRRIEILGKMRRAQIVPAAEPLRERAVVALLADDVCGEQGLQRAHARGRAKDRGSDLLERHAGVRDDLEFGRQRRMRIARREETAGRRTVIAPAHGPSEGEAGLRRRLLRRILHRSDATHTRGRRTASIVRRGPRPGPVGHKVCHLS